MSSAQSPRSKNPFNLYPDQRVAFFIDGANFYAAAKTANMTVDYKRLLNHFDDNSTFKRAYYYTAVNEGAEYSSIQPLLDFLEYNGYKLVTKPLKEFTGPDGRRKVKGSLDVEMTIDMINACEWCDHIVLFSGDSDFTPAIEEVQRRGVKVTIASSIDTVADDLRRTADAFVNIDTAEHIIGRDMDEVPARPPMRPAAVIGDSGMRDSTARPADLGTLGRVTRRV